MKNDKIGISRNILKTTPPRMTAMWFFGIIILASAVFTGTWMGAFLFGGLTDVAYCFGFFVTLLICGLTGWFTVVIQENAQDIKIKVVKEE